MLDLTATAASLRCQPLADRVLIKPREEITRTAGGVHIPDTIQERETPKEGYIVAVGPGKLVSFMRQKPRVVAYYTKDDECITREEWVEHARQPLEVCVGMTVRYSRNAGSDFQIGDVEYLLIHERDILAIIEPDAN